MEIYTLFMRSLGREGNVCDLEVLKVYVKKLSDQNDPGTVDSDSEQQYYSRTTLYYLALLGFQSKMWN